MKVLCEISGGADSIYAALLAQEKYPEAEFHGIMVNYGQSPFEIELIKAEEFCRTHNIELKVIEIRYLFSSGTVEGEEEAANNGVADIYTPLRNMVIGACAASYAETIGAEVIVVGSKGLNDDGGPYSFKDSILPFYVLMNNIINFAAYSPIKIDPILMNGRNIKMTKKEVYEGLLERGVGWNDTWSCFNNYLNECGKCNNCIIKDKIKEEVENDRS